MSQVLAILVFCWELPNFGRSCQVFANAMSVLLQPHPNAHELLYLRRVEPLNGGGAANFRSGAADLRGPRKI